jgi:hypothetical protein
MPQKYSICEKAKKKTNVHSAGLQLDLHSMSYTSSLQEKSEPQKTIGNNPPEG